MTSSERHALAMRNTTKFAGLALCWVAIISVAVYAADGLLRANQGDASAHAFMLYGLFGALIQFFIGSLFVSMANEVNPELPEMDPNWEIL